MSRTYEMSAEAASKAGTSTYITETGKYIGKFTVAEAVVSQQRTEGIEFSFVTNDGQNANFLTLWTHNVDGKQIYGFNVLSAIMTCLKTKSIAPKQIQISDNKGQRTVDGFPDLCGKPIGLLLQREEYAKQDGSVGYKFNISAPFEAATELTAGEILKRTTAPEQLAKMVANLKDRPMQRRAGATTSGSGGSDAGDWTSDVPF